MDVTGPGLDVQCMQCADAAWAVLLSQDRQHANFGVS